MSVRDAGRICAVMLAVTAPLLAQTPPKVAFEVASVRLVEKPTPPKRTITDNRVDLVSYPIREIMLMAYNVEPYRLVVPDWVLDAGMWVEIHGTFPAGSTAKQIPDMLRTLLAERFGMVAHVEARPIDVCELTIAPGGLKMRVVEAVDDRQTAYPVVKGGPDSPPFDSIGGPDNQTRLVLSPDRVTRLVTAETNYAWKDTDHGTVIYDATRVRMAQLVDMVKSSVGKPVVDKTGLTGLYQFQIELPRNMANAARDLERAGITRNANGDPINIAAIRAEPVAGSPFKAVEGLGLKLEEKRLPFDVLVVDKLEQAPTPN
jgi:uncharacterized protein (TIGR03435 family)